jgi:AP endonuclease-1
MMPKSRSFIKQETTESDLSPPPDGLLDEGSSNLPETDSPARKKRRIKTEIEVEQTVDESHTTANSRPRRQVAVDKKEIFRVPDQKKKRKAETSDTEEKVLVGGGVKGKRKTKEEKAAEVMPLLPRTIGHNLFIGAHVSSAGGQSQLSIELDSNDIGTIAFGRPLCCLNADYLLPIFRCAQCRC